MKLLFDIVPKRFDFAIALAEFCKRKMAVNRSSNARSPREVGKIRSIESCKQIIGHQWLPQHVEGNQADFSDTVLQTFNHMQTVTQDGFRAMEERINSLEAKINTHSRVEGSNGN